MLSKGEGGNGSQQKILQDTSHANNHRKTAEQKAGKKKLPHPDIKITEINRKLPI